MILLIIYNVILAKKSLVSSYPTDPYMLGPTQTIDIKVNFKIFSRILILPPYKIFF